MFTLYSSIGYSFLRQGQGGNTAFRKHNETKECYHFHWYQIKIVCFVLGFRRNKQINIHVWAKVFMLPTTARDLQKGFIFKFLFLAYFYFPQIYTYAVKWGMDHSWNNILKLKAKYFSKVIPLPSYGIVPLHLPSLIHLNHLKWRGF